MSRRPPPTLDGCDRHDECTTCPLSLCPYDTVARERMFRGRVDAARHLLAAGWSPVSVALTVQLVPAYVERLAGEREAQL